MVGAGPAFSQPALVYAWTNFAGQPGGVGNTDGTGGEARFFEPSSVAVDSAGNVFVADTGNYAIRKVTSAGGVTTLAGKESTSGTNDGASSVARFNNPEGVTVDTNGNVFVADRNSHTIRKVTSAGVVTTLAGLGGSAGSTDGTNSAARFDSPGGVAVDGAGKVFVADAYNDTIRRVSSAGVVTTLAGRPPASGTNDGTGSAARFYQPQGVAVDSAGNVFVADQRNHTIRKVTSMGMVMTLAGKAGASGTNDGTSSAARLRGPSGVAVDSEGNVFVADAGNHTIRQVTTSGVVTTLAGRAEASGTNDGTGSAARFYVPEGVAVDNAGNVFVADARNHTIRKVMPVGANWEVTALAGSAGVSGTNDGTGSAARFNGPYGVAVDSAGNVFVTEYDSHTIRKVTSTGVVTTLAGSAGTPGTNDGTGSTARFNQPAALAVDSAGALYVADILNHTIRKVTLVGTNWVVTTIGGVAGVMGGADGLGSLANFAWPQGIAVDSTGTLYVAEYANNRITKGSPLYPWLTAGCDGTHLELSWPTNCLGWELQAQSNSPGAGLGTNWSPVDGSTTNTQMSILIDPASPSVFYRLHHE